MIDKAKYLLEYGENEVPFDIVNYIESELIDPPPISVIRDILLLYRDIIDQY